MRNVILAAKGPGRVHWFISRLRDARRLKRCYTQNVDGLEAPVGLCLDLDCGRREGGLDSTCSVLSAHSGCEVVQLHGAMTHVRCGSCGRRDEWTENVNSEYMKGLAPLCPEWIARRGHLRRPTHPARVGHLLRPDMVYYDECHPRHADITFLRDSDFHVPPDLLLVMGTSVNIVAVQEMIITWAQSLHQKGRLVFSSTWEHLRNSCASISTTTWRWTATNGPKRRNHGCV